MLLSPSLTRFSGLATGRFLSRIAFMSVKTAALAPIPKAKVSTAVLVNPGVLRNWRNAKRKSCMRVDSIAHPRPEKIRRRKQIGFQCVASGILSESCTWKIGCDQRMSLRANQRPQADTQLKCYAALPANPRGMDDIYGRHGIPTAWQVWIEGSSPELWNRDVRWWNRVLQGVGSKRRRRSHAVGRYLSRRGREPV